MPKKELSKTSLSKYAIGKIFIRDGTIKTFNDLLDYIPKTKLAADLKMHHDTLKNRIEDNGMFEYGEMVEIAKLLDIETIEFFKLLVPKK